MKTSILSRNKISAQVVALISRLVELIPWPLRRQAMGDVTLSLLNGKYRVAEEVFGWNRATVELGVNESRTGISCVNDLSNRQKPKTEEKYPKLLDDIREIMDPRKGLRATVRLLDAVYEKGVKLCRKERTELEQRLQRSTEFPWYDIMIRPKMVF